MENNSNKKYPERGNQDTPNIEEFINSNPNVSPLKDGSSPVAGENMRRNADTDPNRYSNFKKDDNAPDESENINEHNRAYTGHSYSKEDDFRDESRPFEESKSNIEQQQSDKAPLTGDDKDGFFEGL